MFARSLTESSFMLFDDSGERIGILVQTDTVMFLTKQGKYEFESIDELYELTGPIEFREIKKLVKTTDIEGYPIRHDQFYDVETHDNITSYASTPGGKRRFCAGWFSVKYERGYLTWLAPQLNSLVQDEFTGPYKTQHEAMIDSKSKNRATGKTK